MFIGMLVNGCAREPKVFRTDLTTQAGLYVLGYSADPVIRQAMERQLVADLEVRGITAFASYEDLPELEVASATDVVQAANARRAVAIILINRVTTEGTGSVVSNPARVTPLHPDLKTFYRQSRGEMFDPPSGGSPVFAEVNLFLVDGAQTRLYWSGSTWADGLDGHGPVVRTFSSIIVDELVRAVGAALPDRNVGRVGIERLRNSRIDGLNSSLVVLENGRGQRVRVDGTSSEVTLDDLLLWEGDVDGDGLIEALGVLSVADESSAGELYLVALGGRARAEEHVSTVSLGRGIQIRDLLINGAQVDADLVVHGPNDAASSPTMLVRRSWQLTGEALVDAGETSIGRLSSDTLNGTRWQLISLAAGEANQPDRVDAPVELEFSAGSVTGIAGCNRFSARVESPLPGALALGPLRSTRMACADSVMATEARFLDGFGAAFQYGFVIGRLAVLYDRAGRTDRMLFRPLAATP